ncbi:MAG: glycosyltransferase [Thermoanaerobaculia bacterium]|jgi:glycosyltransferase involved in cell wall biosynthesis
MKPLVSVVMSVFNEPERLATTIESVLAQSYDRLELVIVNDGSSDPGVGSILSHFAASDPRVTIVEKKNEGLTLALIDACRAARGELIARIDSGDRMESARIALQAALLSESGECVLATSVTEFHGPEWEHLWFSPRPALLRGRPLRFEADAAMAERAFDITHHGSVMFRRSSYEQCGGYRPQFYVGQDWDLWYRLGETGDFCAVSEVLYHARIFPRSISMEQAGRQREIAECSLGAAKARAGRADEGPWLDRAAAIRPMNDSSARRASAEPGFYFVGEALRRNGDPACRRYLADAVRERPLSLRSWVRLVQSLTLSSNSRQGRAGKGRRG